MKVTRLESQKESPGDGTEGAFPVPWCYFQVTRFYSFDTFVLQTS